MKRTPFQHAEHAAKAQIALHVLDMIETMLQGIPKVDKGLYAAVLRISKITTKERLRMLEIADSSYVEAGLSPKGRRRSAS